eukprot:Colp12_sorted_trinity150504_noHs@4363
MDGADNFTRLRIEAPFRDAPLDVIVGDAVLLSTTVEGLTFRVRTYRATGRTNDDMFMQGVEFPMNVERTFTSFEWLHAALILEYPDVVVPSCPEKPVQELLKDKEHVEKKRRRLQRFLRRVCAHPSLCASKTLSHFLTTSRFDMPDILKASKADDKKKNKLSAFFKTMVTHTEQSGLKQPPATELGQLHETRCAEICKFITTSETGLHALVAALSGYEIKEKELSKALGTVSTELSRLSQVEEKNTVGPQLVALAQILTKAYVSHSEKLEGSIELLGDLALEYERNIQDLKRVYNKIVDVLNVHAAALKLITKRQGELREARRSLSGDTSVVQHSTRELAKAEAEERAARDAYDKELLNFCRELDLYK